MFLVEVLSEDHRRDEFDCGVEPLNVYLRNFANQDVRRGLSSAYVLVSSEMPRVFGYYTLSQCGALPTDFPQSVSKKLPSNRIVPCTLLGRLAVDKSKHGEGIGTILISNALSKAHSASLIVASFAVVVEAKDHLAAQFYEKFGFAAFRDDANKLFLPMKVVKDSSP